jgi:hypothetical protein
MKNVSLLILMFACLNSSAQGVFTNQTNAAIEKVIQDYPNQFKNITGPLLLEKQQSCFVPGDQIQLRPKRNLLACGTVANRQV